MISHISHLTSQPYALKSSGGFARLTNDYTQRQPQVLHERLRLAFLFAPPPMGEGSQH